MTATDGPVAGPGLAPSMTLTEAAKATGKHRRTLVRYLDAGRFPNAFQETGPTGQPQWRVPVVDLIAADLTVDKPAAPVPEPTPAADMQATPADDLRQRLAEAETRAAVAEAKVQGLTMVVATQREALELAEVAMRMLGAGPPVNETPAPAPQEATTSPPAPADDFQTRTPRRVRAWAWRRR